jgi:hypothetical protein
MAFLPPLFQYRSLFDRGPASIAPLSALPSMKEGNQWSFDSVKRVCCWPPLPFRPPATSSRYRIQEQKQQVFKRPRPGDDPSLPFQRHGQSEAESGTRDYIEGAKIEADQLT